MESRTNTAPDLDKDSVQALSLKLILAIQEVKLDEIRRLISAGADLAYCYNGKTAIEHAVASNFRGKLIEIIASSKPVDANDTYRYGSVLNQHLTGSIILDTNIVCVLLRAGARPDNKTHTLSSMLFKAVKNIDIQLIKVLLEHGVDLSVKNSDGYSVMTVAGMSSLWQCIEAIASSKTTDAGDTYEYQNALLYAVSNKKLQTVKILLKANAKTNTAYAGTGDTALHAAVHNNDIPMLKLLLEHHADLSAVNKKQLTPMQLAVSLGKWDCVEEIAKAAKTDEKDSYHYHDALLAAIKEQKILKAMFLLAANTPATGKVNGNPLIHIAIESRNSELVTKFIQNGAKLADVNISNQTAMEYALSIGAWDFITMLAANKKTDETDSYQYGCALVEAVKNNKLDIAIALMTAGALNNSKNKAINKILFTALESSSKEMVLALIAHGANMGALNENGKSPIQQAAENSLWDMVKAMAGAKKTDESDSYRYGAALLKAIEYNKYSVASALLAAGPVKHWRSADTKYSAVHYAVTNSNVEMITLLLQHACSLSTENAGHETPIVMAANQRKWKLLGKILELQSTDEQDANQYGKAAIIMLSAGAHRDDIKLMIKAGVCKKAENATNLLVEAVRLGRLEIAEELLNAGANINGSLTSDQSTALHVAVRSNNIKALRFVLEKGASQTVISHSKTPLELAIHLAHWDCAQLLLEFDHNDGNDKQLLADLHYEAALLSAIKQGNYAIAKLLLEHHAPFDKWDSVHGNLALYWAVKNNEKNPEIISLLLEQGADASIRNKDGKTIADVAKELGHTECLKRLRIYGGHIHPGKTADQYRAEADTVFQEMCGYSLTPDILPEKIVRLSEYSRAILECDLATLIRRRDELNKSKTETLPQLLDVTDSISDSVKLNKTIDAIQSLLTHPHAAPPSYQARNEDRNEAKDISDFLHRKGAMDGYIKNVKRYLIALEHQIDNTHWLKYRPLFKDFAQGVPKHVLAMKAQLKKLKTFNTRDEIFEIYAEIRKILLSIKKNDKRHDSTMAFYREQLQKADGIRFIEEVKVHEDVAVIPLTKEMLSTTVNVSQKVAEGYVPVYPNIDVATGTINYQDLLQRMSVTTSVYPVLENHLQETLLQTNIQAAPVIVATGDLIQFDVAAEQPVTDEKDLVLPSAPVKPIVRQASLSDLYKQPVEKVEEKPHAAPRRQLVPA